MNAPSLAELHVAGTVSLGDIDGVVLKIIAAAHLDVAYATSHNPGGLPEWKIVFTGPDTPLLTARHGELLQAIEHLVCKAGGLDATQHDLVSCDAGDFKKNRDQALFDSAQAAAAVVQQTGRPYTFAPMSSHERRLLHLALTPTGLHTASTGEGAQRAVVLYPPRQGSEPPSRLTAPALERTS